jgi:hypothetical protein
MRRFSKRQRKLLGEAMDEAYRRELERELKLLDAGFERWRRGKCSAFDLSDQIHQFHHGPNRKLFGRYADGDPLLTVAGAVHAGVLRLQDVHPDVREPVNEVVTAIFEAPGTESE